MNKRIYKKLVKRNMRKHYMSKHNRRVLKKIVKRTLELTKNLVYTFDDKRTTEDDLSHFKL